MPRNPESLLEAAEEFFARQETEVVAERERSLRSVITQAATGTGDVDVTFGLDQRFRLAFVRAHFSGGAGTAPLSLSVDSAAGTAYDTKLFTVSQAGTNTDVHLRIGGADAVEPSAWTFQVGDKLRIQWTNPDNGNMTWGVEVGLILAS